MIPNETEAAGLTGLPVVSIEDARKAGDVLLGKGAGTALITLGARGALFHNGKRSVMIDAFNAGKVVETAGAGDSFVGAFTAGLAEGMEPVAAARFGCAAAAISVTRPGTAPAMPTRAEIAALVTKLAEGLAQHGTLRIIETEAHRRLVGLQPVRSRVAGGEEGIRGNVRLKGGLQQALRSAQRFEMAHEIPCIGKNRLRAKFGARCLAEAGTRQEAQPGDIIGQRLRGML